MIIKQYQVDAFASQAFEGNPAAVCPLEKWLEDSVMQSIAEENNLSETAFFVPAEKGFHLRWFTPFREVDLCGHATLATAHVIFDILGFMNESIVFETRSGELTVQKAGHQLQMDFPANPPKPCPVPDTLIKALGQKPIEVLAADDYIAVYEGEEVIRSIHPDMFLLSQIDLRCVVITAPGTDFDFVSRCFGPKYGIPEDPVTGSSHCELAPYWAKKLKKKELNARQVSKRGGNVSCELVDDRVLLKGSAISVMESRIIL